MQRRLYPQWNEERYLGIAGHFNVAPQQRIRELSRGERAGVNLAIAMAQSPELLILDELWVAEFPFLASGAEFLPGVLQVQRIDGLFHFIVLDQDDTFGDRLEEKGARRAWQGAVDLDRAVNAFLSRNHARPFSAQVQTAGNMEGAQ